MKNEDVEVEQTESKEEYILTEQDSEEVQTEEQIQQEEREEEERKQREDREHEVAELREKQQQAKEVLEEQSRNAEMVSTFMDDEGTEIAARQRGTIALEMLNIEEQIVQVRRFRGEEDEVHGLQDSIRRYGLLEPIQVVPYGDAYILLQGYRRLQAFINLGKTRILAVVDHTIPPELAKYFQVELNNVKSYRFVEKLNYGKYVEETQPQIGTDVIEQSLGLNAGEYLKMKYVEQFRGDFPEIFMQVQNERMTIDQAYKKIDKEIEKQQKELEKSEVESEAMDDLKNVDELSELANEIKQQELGKRKILEPVIRRSVEARAGGTCECCGYGRDEPDLMGAFQVHHIVPVMYGGDDSKGNLVLLCRNCHSLAHDYETGRFTPEQETYDRLDEVKRIVVLGNILRYLRTKTIKLLRTKHIEISRQVDKGVLTIGQGLLKSKSVLKWQEDFEETPYDTFIESTENIRFGGQVTGEYSRLDVETDEEGTITEKLDMEEEDHAKEEPVLEEIEQPSVNNENIPEETEHILTVKVLETETKKEELVLEETESRPVMLLDEEQEDDEGEN